jgi:hypothetical protein
MVIYFTIKNDPDALIFVVYGLAAGSKVYDAETGHTDPGSTFRPGPRFIRTPMAYYGAHGMQKVLFYVQAMFFVNYSDYSAH